MCCPNSSKPPSLHGCSSNEVNPSEPPCTIPSEQFLTISQKVIHSKRLVGFIVARSPGAASTEIWVGDLQPSYQNALLNQPASACWQTTFQPPYTQAMIPALAYPWGNLKLHILCFTVQF